MTVHAAKSTFQLFRVQVITAIGYFYCYDQENARHNSIAAHVGHCPG
jgi:hypothetical protein